MRFRAVHRDDDAVENVIGILKLGSPFITYMLQQWDLENCTAWINPLALVIPPCFSLYRLSWSALGLFLLSSFLTGGQKGCPVITVSLRI